MDMEISRIMDKKVFDTIVRHKVEKVCKLYFDIQEKHMEEFEQINLFDSDWDMMVRFATADYDEVDSHDMNSLNRVWRTYNKYKTDGLIISEWDGIDVLIKEGKKISAIKEYRKKHNCGLKEAKDAVDSRQEILENQWMIS